MVGIRMRPPPTPVWDGLLGQRYDLVVLDGVTEALAVFGAASKDNDEVTAWIRRVPRTLAQRTGAAVVLVDHVTKDADTRGRYAIGGQAKLAALDGAAYVVEVLEPLGVGMVGRLALRVAKDRPGQVRPRSGSWRKSDRTQEAAVVVVDSRQSDRTLVTVEPLRSDQHGGGADTTGAFRPTALMERVSRHLEGSSRAYPHQAGGGGHGPQEVRRRGHSGAVDRGLCDCRRREDQRPAHAARGAALSRVGGPGPGQRDRVPAC